MKTNYSLSDADVHMVWTSQACRMNVAPVSLSTHGWGYEQLHFISVSP